MSRVIRLTGDVARALERHYKKPGETWNDAVRRLLGLATVGDRRKGKRWTTRRS
jgi:hypothetical protein